MRGRPGLSFTSDHKKRRTRAVGEKPSVLSHHINVRRAASELWMQPNVSKLKTA